MLLAQGFELGRELGIGHQKRQKPGLAVFQRAGDFVRDGEKVHALLSGHLEMLGKLQRLALIVGADALAVKLLRPFRHLS